jgi:hypothetical protein
MCVHIERVGWLSKRDGWFVIEKWMATHEESWQVVRDQWKERDGCYRWLVREILV